MTGPWWAAAARDLEAAAARDDDLAAGYRARVGAARAGAPDPATAARIARNIEVAAEHADARAAEARARAARLRAQHGT